MIAITMSSLLCMSDILTVT